MNIVDRVKNILITPKTEWDVIAAETTPTAALVTGYVLPLAAISAVAYFIGICLVGTSMGFLGTYRMPIVWGLAVTIWHLVAAVIAVFVVGFIVDALAPTFGAQKNSAQAFKIAVYSYTPAWVAGVLMIVPLLGVLVLLASLYAIYLMYLGLPRLMKNPEDKSIAYTAVTIICAIVVSVIISVIGGLIAAPAMMASGSLGMGTPAHTSRAMRADPSSPMGKLETFGRQMEEANKKMEAAQKSGDPNKQAEAAMAALGTAISGGKNVEPLQLDQIKAFVPDSFAGLPRTGQSSERAGAAGFMTAKAEGTYGDSAGKQVQLEVVDTGGVAGLMGLATWAGVMSERETDERIERTHKEGTRVVHEEVSKRGGRNKYGLVLNDRFLVSASGSGVDINALKAGVASLDLAKLESMK
jgi:hypothetical protein